jgi:Domain of unknown function (DUF4136)
MKMAAVGFYLVASLGLSATRAAAQEVSVDYDRQADFSKCATYAWAPGTPSGNPLADRRIVEAIDAALASKGFRKSEENPGCLVTYHASVKEQKSLRVWESGFRFRGGVSSVDVDSVLNGMLVVDIADAGKKQLIWRGVAKDTISDKPEKNQKKLAKVVEKLFKDVPPGSGK